MNREIKFRSCYEEQKCKICNKKGDWFYETKDDWDFYCDEHLPCGKFKKFIGEHIVPFIRMINNIILK